MTKTSKSELGTVQTTATVQTASNKFPVKDQTKSSISIAPIVFSETTFANTTTAPTLQQWVSDIKSTKPVNVSVDNPRSQKVSNQPYSSIYPTSPPKDIQTWLSTATTSVTVPDPKKPVSREPDTLQSWLSSSKEPITVPNAKAPVVKSTSSIAKPTKISVPPTTAQPQFISNNLDLSRNRIKTLQRLESSAAREQSIADKNANVVLSQYYSNIRAMNHALQSDLQLFTANKYAKHERALKRAGQLESSKKELENAMSKLSQRSVEYLELEGKKNEILAEIANIAILDVKFRDPELFTSELAAYEAQQAHQYQQTTISNLVGQLNNATNPELRAKTLSLVNLLNSGVVTIFSDSNAILSLFLETESKLVRMEGDIARELEQRSNDTFRIQEVLKSQLSAKDTENAELKQQVSQLQSDMVKLQTTMVSMDAELAGTSISKNDLVQRYEKISTEAMAAKAEADKANKQLKDAMKVLETLREFSRLRDATGLKQKETELEDLMKNITEDTQSLTAEEVNFRESMIGVIRASIAQAAEITTQTERTNSLTHQVKTLLENMEQLNGEKAGLSAQLSRIADLEQNKTELEYRLTVAEERLKSATQQAAVSASEREVLQKQIDSLSARNKQDTADLQRLQSDIAHLQTSYGDSQKQSRNQIQSLNRELEKTRNAIITSYRHTYANANAIFEKQNKNTLEQHQISDQTEVSDIIKWIAELNNGILSEEVNLLKNTYESSEIKQAESMATMIEDVKRSSVNASLLNDIINKKHDQIIALRAEKDEALRLVAELTHNVTTLTEKAVGLEKQLVATTAVKNKENKIIEKLRSNVQKLTVENEKYQKLINTMGLEIDGDFNIVSGDPITAVKEAAVQSMIAYAINNKIVKYDSTGKWVVTNTSDAAKQDLTKMFLGAVDADSSLMRFSKGNNQLVDDWNSEHELYDRHSRMWRRVFTVVYYDKIIDIVREALSNHTTPVKPQSKTQREVNLKDLRDDLRHGKIEGLRFDLVFPDYANVSAGLMRMMQSGDSSGIGTDGVFGKVANYAGRDNLIKSLLNTMKTLNLKLPDGTVYQYVNDYTKNSMEKALKDGGDGLIHAMLHKIDEHLNNELNYNGSQQIQNNAAENLELLKYLRKLTNKPK